MRVEGLSQMGSKLASILGRGERVNEEGRNLLSFSSLLSAKIADIGTAVEIRLSFSKVVLVLEFFRHRECFLQSNGQLVGRFKRLQSRNAECKRGEKLLGEGRERVGFVSSSLPLFVSYALPPSSRAHIPKP